MEGAISCVHPASCSSPLPGPHGFTKPPNSIKKGRSMRRALVVFLLGMASLFARAASDCWTVGGTISTNFTDATTTFGSATGDLAGGIGVSVLNITQNANGTLTFRNRHSWVTSSGDTINTKPADATAFPTGIPGLYAASYVNGLVVTGGTGKFANALGKIYSWGAVNLTANEIVLRYEGTVCFADRD